MDLLPQYCSYVQMVLQDNKKRIAEIKKELMPKIKTIMKLVLDLYIEGVDLQEALSRPEVKLLMSEILGQMGRAETSMVHSQLVVNESAEQRGQGRSCRCLDCSGRIRLVRKSANGLYPEGALVPGVNRWSYPPPDFQPWDSDSDESEVVEDHFTLPEAAGSGAAPVGSDPFLEPVAGPSGVGRSFSCPLPAPESSSSDDESVPPLPVVPHGYTAPRQTARKTRRASCPTPQVSDEESVTPPPPRRYFARKSVGLPLPPPPPQYQLVVESSSSEEEEEEEEMEDDGEDAAAMVPDPIVVPGWVWDPVNNELIEQEDLGAEEEVWEEDWSSDDDQELLDLLPNQPPEDGPVMGPHQAPFWFVVNAAEQGIDDEADSDDYMDIG